MRVFVTGATGFIGSAVVRELLDAGHQVTGLARSDKAAAALMAAGAKAHRGTLEDVESLRSGAATAEGAIHLAFMSDFSHASVSTRLGVMFGGSPRGIISRFMAATLGADRRAIETLGTALTGHDRALVVAFGTMALSPGRLVTEDDAPDRSAVGGPRGFAEEAILTLASRGVRASAVRLAPVVHGTGDQGGFVPRLIAAARKKGVSAYVGDGHNRWPAVHRLDAARLFRLALEKGEAGAKYHGVAEQGVPVLDIANLIGQRLKAPVAALSPKEAARTFSWLAPFLSVDNPASSALTQQRLGWQPEGPGLIADLEQGDYFHSET